MVRGCGALPGLMGRGAGGAAEAGVRDAGFRDSGRPGRRRRGEKRGGFGAFAFCGVCGDSALSPTSPAGSRRRCVLAFAPPPGTPRPPARPAPARRSAFLPPLGRAVWGRRAGPERVGPAGSCGSCSVSLIFLGFLRFSVRLRRAQAGDEQGARRGPRTPGPGPQPEADAPRASPGAQTALLGKRLPSGTVRSALGRRARSEPSDGSCEPRGRGVRRGCGAEGPAGARGSLVAAIPCPAGEERTPFSCVIPASHSGAAHSAAWFPRRALRGAARCSWNPRAGGAGRAPVGKQALSGALAGASVQHATPFRRVSARAQAGRTAAEAEAEAGSLPRKEPDVGLDPWTLGS
ncbi:translation initiation factor IF-2-like isoform X2 [Mustela putorius furo]|uniref:Translation initiation factor IF-2-like isoform X2 n=1 Tax=Mustela putorius furo TaxID=9669 RepID=A0A8U0SEW1_MUSPF|nr:translation initiation factor IF-2-like isoform X2 [Mustela putorius furo]